MKKKTIIIVNPKAGKRLFLNLYLHQVIKVFEGKKVDYRIFYTRYSGHASVIVRKNLKNLDFVSVFGGDGTIREVVKGMGDHPLPLGIIPFGTVNVLALDLGISFNPVVATVTIVEGYQKRIDIGYLNDEPFLLMVSTGIDALAVHNVDLRAKRIFGQIAYVISALWSAFTYRARKIKLHLEDQKIKDRGYLAIISNSRFYGGRFKIDKEACIDDGLLNVILFKKSSILDTFRLLMGVLTNTHKRMKDIVFYTARDICITARSRVHMQMDGDKAPATPARVRVRKRFLPVIVPRNKQGQEGLEAVRTLLNNVFVK